MTPPNAAIAAVLALCLIFAALRGALKRRSQLAALEIKVQYLYDKSGIVFEPAAALAPAIRKAVAAGKKIEAIKMYREVTGSSLRSAKEAVERIAS